MRFAAVTRHAQSRVPEVTFRKPALEAFASVGGLILLGSYMAAALIPKRNFGVFLGAVIFAAFIYVIWLIGFHSAVRFYRDAAIIDNLLARHVIPWEELAAIGVVSGLVFKLRDGRKVSSVMFGGSVMGALLRYRYTREVAARMNSARTEIAANSSPATGDKYYVTAGFSAWPPVIILALVEAIAVLAYITR
jgi:hypothetical protein